MAFNKYKLYYKTQSPKFLLISIFVIFLSGLCVSTLINSLYQTPSTEKSTIHNLVKLTLFQLNEKKYEDELTKAIKNQKLDIEELIVYFEIIAFCDKPKLLNITIDVLNKNETINPNFKTFALFLKSVLNETEIENLKIEAEKSPPQIYANRLLAFIYEKKSEFDLAIKALMNEPTLRQSNLCKATLVSLLIKNEKIQELKNIVDDPNFKELKFEIQSKILTVEKNWKLVFLNILDYQTNIKYNGIFFLTIITGIVWFSIWFHALRPDHIISAFTLCIFAFALGVFSTTLTLFAIDLEQYYTNISEGETLIQGLIFFIFSVGLREEFLKILMFLPLIPILLKRQNQLEWLIIPGMVGLGFAIEENLNYFIASNAESFAGRFLTANFFHVGLTAIIGESLVYYCYDRSRGPQHFLSTFSMAVIIHGLYDAFISVPQLNELSFITSIVFIYIAFQFFGRLKLLRSNLIEPISLSTHFILGLTVLFMCAFIYFSHQGGHYFAAKQLSMTAIELSITIYMFLYVMPNSIIKL